MEFCPPQPDPVGPELEDSQLKLVEELRFLSQHTENIEYLLSSGAARNLTRFLHQSPAVMLAALRTLVNIGSTALRNVEHRRILWCEPGLLDAIRAIATNDESECLALSPALSLRWQSTSLLTAVTRCYVRKLPFVSQP